MQKALLYGSLTTIIIENMRLERDEKVSDMMEREMQQPVIEKEDTQEQEAPAAQLSIRKQVLLLYLLVKE